MKALRACLTLCLSIGFAAAALAQGPLGQKPEEFSVEGQVQAIGPNQMKIQSNANQTWMISILPNTKVSVVGTATADFLQPGMFLRFDAEFDKRGTAKEKIGKATIFTPNAEQACGAWPKGSAGGLDAFGKGDPMGAPEVPKKGKPVKAAQEGGPLTVAGKITGVKNGAITLNTGDMNYKIELADDAEIGVKVSDYTWARQGDTITAKGRAMPGMQMGQAADVKITGGEAFSSGTATKGKPGAKPKPIKKDPPAKKDPPTKKEPPVKKEPGDKKSPGKNGAFDDVINGFD